jgi:hypothetical protein
MNYKKFSRERHAVAGVIEALLLVALVATVISMIQFYYIPDVMEQREAEHMDEVSNQFSYLKSMIDIQSITESDVPMYSIITLGSRELPYFITARATGEIRIVNSDDSSIAIDFANITTLTSIKYEAYNSYFVDQTYALEGGGIIVDQPEGESVMRVDPAVSMIDASQVTIYFDLPSFIDIPGKNGTNSHGKCFIRTNYSGFDTQPFSNVSNIRIFTNYPHAWYESLNNTLGGVVNINEEPNYVEITRNIKPINV